ncbi:MarR family winged helix-turn-helix transcriptional regulator [sulfur-oxidizing endosymbiont of Gigantopelta aegis]|uniref:MarR family winged helix-turn-helix transcriptional regulator n=1 Tax=sulfur-oxidizing endosymbiont of Gigantopelta aegis TaxID=2794934 RepID=UPI0018DBCECE|nr:MarR family transcriptional regulator [sulfur-oxidizing endosymbiont of Gigantopelta aegis]
MDKKTVFKHKKPDDSAGFLLWKITSLWQNKLSNILSVFKINQTQFAIMASLKWFEEHNEETTQAHLVEHSKIEKMTVSKSLKNLENKNLIIRVKSKRDARALNIEFTKKGINTINKAIVAIEKADDEFFSSLSAQELKQYKSIIVKVIKNNGL